ncbi:MAG: cache domain-containing protein [Defluviicoccus sp.]
MLKNLFAPLAGVLCLLFVAPTLAGERGSLDEAKAMALHAADALLALGRDAAFPAFETPGPPFHDRDLYIFVLDRAGVIRAHGTTRSLVGQNWLDSKDSRGRAFVREIVAVNDQAWVDYTFADPISGKVLPKRTYVVRVGDYLVGVGAYVND